MEEDSRIEFSIGHLQGFKRTTSPLLPTHQDGVHRAEAVFAVVNGREVGFALYFYNFSTFVGHSGLYLEDLFVWPEHRGKGYGKALLLHLVKIAREHHCGRMEWMSLDWNKTGNDFYRSLGAVPIDDCRVYRLDTAALDRLGKQE